MYEAIKKVVEYCNKAWKVCLSQREIEASVDQFIYELSVSNKNYIEHHLLTLLCGLAEDSMNGSTEAKTYYEAIMDYIMAE